MSYPDRPITVNAKAPLKIDYNGNVYHRLGGTDMSYVSKFHQDNRGFWLLASLYYNAATNIVFEFTCDGHITESDFQDVACKKTFREVGTNTVLQSTSYFRYCHYIAPIIEKRMSYLGLKPKKYDNKKYGRDCMMLHFKTAEDYAVFQFYFAEYFE